jgi:predicted DNA-binding protein YlxM (UPF0122 family)
MYSETSRNITEYLNYGSDYALRELTELSGIDRDSVSQTIQTIHDLIEENLFYPNNNEVVRRLLILEKLFINIDVYIV